MLKSLLIVSCLVTATGLGACATHSGISDKVSAQTAQNTPQNPDCIHDTGTRIRQPEKQCVNVPGSAYSKADLDRTGEIDVGAALQKLDPRFH